MLTSRAASYIGWLPWPTASIVIVQGPNEGREFDISGATSIGRDTSAGLVIDDPEASRRHASLSLEGDGAEGRGPRLHQRHVRERRADLVAAGARPGRQAPDRHHRLRGQRRGAGGGGGPGHARGHRAAGPRRPPGDGAAPGAGLREGGAARAGSPTRLRPSRSLPSPIQPTAAGIPQPPAPAPPTPEPVAPEPVQPTAAGIPQPPAPTNAPPPSSGPPGGIVGPPGGGPEAGPPPPPGGAPPPPSAPPPPPAPPPSAPPPSAPPPATRRPPARPQRTAGEGSLRGPPTRSPTRPTTPRPASPAGAASSRASWPTRTCSCCSSWAWRRVRVPRGVVRDPLHRALPRGLFDFLTGTMRWSNRVTGFSQFMTEQYPPFSLDEAPVPDPDPVPVPEGGIARWRPLAALLHGLPAHPRHVFPVDRPRHRAHLPWF